MDLGGPTVRWHSGRILKCRWGRLVTGRMERLGRGGLQKSFNTLLTEPGPSSLRGPALPDHQHELVGAVGVADGGDFGGPCGG